MLRLYIFLFRSRRANVLKRDCPCHSPVWNSMSASVFPGCTERPLLQVHVEADVAADIQVLP